MEDALLISLFFKNPPGRILRRQWTAESRVFPEFNEWLQLEDLQFGSQLDIKQDRVGGIRQNSKLSFPSDNSIIRVEKYMIANKIMGESIILKDNF